MDGSVREMYRKTRRAPSGEIEPFVTVLPHDRVQLAMQVTAVSAIMACATAYITASVHEPRTGTCRLRVVVLSRRRQA